MAGVFDKLRARLDQPAHAYTPTTQTFPDLDVNRLAKELRLDERGAEDGKAELPPSDSEVMGRTEAEIAEIVSAAQKSNTDQLENHLAGYRQRLIDLDFEHRFADISAAAAANLADLTAELQKGLDELHPLRRHLAEAEEWRDDFKKRHGLRRPAKLSGRMTQTIKVLLLILLVMVEAWINGSFLAKDYGIVGGVIEAVSFAAFNVIGAFFIALYGIRGLIHRNLGLKLWGLLALGAYLVLAAGINLGLAHYREVSQTLLEGAGAGVMARFAERPLTLDDFNSWILLGLGVFFSLAAMIDGLVFTDPYFGYAHMEKRVRAARDDYLRERRALIENLQAVRQDYEDVLTEARGDLGKRRTEHNAIVDNRVRLVRLHGQAEGQLESAANMLLTNYRDANRKARSTPAPKRFDEVHKLPRSETGGGLSDGEWNAEKLEIAIKQAHAELNLLLGRLSEKFEAALERYRELDKLVPDKQ